jgi:hypothetical protein
MVHGYTISDQIVVIITSTRTPFGRFLGNLLIYSSHSFFHAQVSAWNLLMKSEVTGSKVDLFLHGNVISPGPGQN